MVHDQIDIIVRCWDMAAAGVPNEGATAEHVQDAHTGLGLGDGSRMNSRRSTTGATVPRCSTATSSCIPWTAKNFRLQASEFLRASNWSIPPELVVFAGDGQGAVFGLWLPEDDRGRALVVEAGPIFEKGSLSVTGTSLGGFLRGRTAYYLLLLDAPNAAMELLGLPKRFRATHADDLDDEDYRALLRWANPDLPEHPVSSYEARLTADDVRRLARASG